MTILFHNSKTGHSLGRSGRHAFMVHYPSGDAYGFFNFRDALKIYRYATAPSLLRWNVEVTDTFGGEANYAWVRRYSFKAPEGATGAAIMRRAKREAGYSGIRGRRSDYGDTLEFRPYGECVVMFVSLDA